MSLNSKSLCVRDDNTTSSWVTALMSNSSTLSSRINNIGAQGGSGTNVCGGLAKGWEILEGSGNHMDVENNLRYLVLLSDGDNNYYGQYTYQSTPYVSPHTYQGLPCQPPSSCSNVGGESNSSSAPCHNGIDTKTTTSTSTETVVIASDDFDDSSSFNGGTGWSSSSWSTNSTQASLQTSSSPKGTRHVRLIQTSSSNDGQIQRTLSTTDRTNVEVEFYAKRSSSANESTDRLYVEVSTNGSSWTTLGWYAGASASGSEGTLSTSYRSSAYSLDLPSSFENRGTVYLRFRSSVDNNSSDQIFVDSVTVKGTKTSTTSVTEPDPNPENGYQNGQDGSPVGCSTARPRERQMDMLTWAMAKAIEADGVEIYVVGFGTCSPDSTVYTDAQCDAQIGNSDSDDTADERLLKCIASSTGGYNDHYFYAGSATELPTILTQIARQIGHRLIE
jgi:hypothetical protein